jgi:hexosaminidase
MMRSPLRLLLAGVLALGAAGTAFAQRAPLVPAPAVEQPASGSFTLSNRTPVVVPAGDAGARAAANYYLDLMSRSRGLKLKVAQQAPGNTPAVVFRRGGPAGEAYQLEAGPTGIVITSSGDAGLFYGGVTAWQLATGQAGRGPVEIAGVRIEDAPRFAWRGLMLDSVRHIQSMDYIKGFIDRMARAKLNTLHWHLTDDQGWRLEIRKYPKLTQVGGWRVPAGRAALEDIDPKTGKPRLYGGFYTQAQAREIVAYAAARHITVVPEIEMPGHATAAIAAYPELGSGPARPMPSSDWGIFEDIFNVEETTFSFLEDVLDEVMEIFPSKYIHVGGDEAVKPQWKSNPKVQARMRELHIGEEEALQGWFTQRMDHYLKGKGRRLIGWDEILEGGVSKSATVMSWRGSDGAIIAAKKGHDTVMAAAPVYYFDNNAVRSPVNPAGRGYVVDLKMVYDFDPIPASLTPAQAKHVLGVQGQLWAEHIRTEDKHARLAFPRAFALAETGWSPAERREWTSFVERLRPQVARERALGELIGDIPPLVSPPPLQASFRKSQELKLCEDGMSLNIEDDGPVRGDRAVYLVDPFNPCWIWEGADLTDVSTITATVGQVPWNFQVGEARNNIKWPKPNTPEGEFVVRLDSCTGPVVATIPMAPATRTQATTVLTGALAKTEGKHDLCLTFLQPQLDPYWVLDSIRLGAPPRGR